MSTLNKVNCLPSLVLCQQVQEVVLWFNFFGVLDFSIFLIKTWDINAGIFYWSWFYIINVISFLIFSSFLKNSNERSNNTFLLDPSLFEGDIVLDPDEREGMKNGNAYASIKGGRWPNARIPYVIDSSIGMQFICLTI